MEVRVAQGFHFLLLLLLFLVSFFFFLRGSYVVKRKN